MEKFYVGIEAGNANAEAIVSAHVGKAIGVLRAALRRRFHYDPVETVHDQEHEARLRQQNKIILAVDDAGLVSRA